jgi:hypothetical protein
MDFRNRRIVLSDEARKWQSDMQFLIPRFAVVEGSFVQVDFAAYYRFYNRNGSLRKLDTSNFQFLLHNTIAKRIGIDDAYFKWGSFSSVDSEDEKVEVTLCERRH